MLSSKLTEYSKWLAFHYVVMSLDPKKTNINFELNMLFLKTKNKALNFGFVGYCLVFCMSQLTYFHYCCMSNAVLRLCMLCCLAVACKSEMLSHWKSRVNFASDFSGARTLSFMVMAFFFQEVISEMPKLKSVFMVLFAFEYFFCICTCNVVGETRLLGFLLDQIFKGLL